VTAAPEFHRNRVLRRADWRFLLGAPAPALSISYGEAGLQEAVRAVSQRMVDGTRGNCNNLCDVAVAQNPNGALLHTLMASLRPGGSCYTEWSSRFGPGPAGIRSRLLRAGFVDVTCYSPRPSLTAPPQVWLPLGVRAARRWHLAQSDSQRLKTAARRIGWKAAEWAPLTLPICAVARKSSGGPVPTAEDAVLDFQFELDRAVTEATGGEKWRHRRSPWVLASHGEHSINKIILLGLADNGHVEFIVKVPRVAAAAAGIDREAFALQQVRVSCKNVPGVPELLFSRSCAGIQVVGESALEGVPLTRAARNVDYRSVARKAAHWQARLVHTPAAWWNSPNQFLGPILSFIEGPLATVVEAELIRITKVMLQQLGPLRMTCEQRDFSPWNILVTPSGDLAVLDWESAETHGVPALDLIYFLTYFAAAQDGALTPERVCSIHPATRDRSSRFGSVTEECLDEYSALVGLSVSDLTALRLLCWLVHARSEYVRVKNQSGTSQADRTLRDSVFVSLWKQETRIAAGSNA
jgi:hypothetical protein